MTEQEERRKAVRRRALKSAKIVFNGRMSTMDVTVRNESDDGALIILDNTSLVPTDFEFSNYPVRGFHDAEVIWRSEKSMGVRLKSAAKSNELVPNATSVTPEEGQGERRVYNRRSSDIPEGAERVPEFLPDGRPELRKLERRKVLKTAVLVYNNRMSTMNATIRNESAEGAMCIVDNTSVVPNEIEIKNYPVQGYHDAEVVWRSEKALGLRFKRRP